MDKHSVRVSTGNSPEHSKQYSDDDIGYIINGFTKITDGNDELLKRLIKSFQKVSDETIETVQEYPEDLTEEELYDQVHKIKPMLDYLGFKSNTNCITIKEAIKNDIPADIQKEIDSLVSELILVKRVVNEKLSN